MILDKLIHKIQSRNDLSDTTKKNYKNRINVIYKFLPEKWTLDHIMKNPKKFDRVMNRYLKQSANGLNLKTKLTYITMILLCFDDSENEDYKQWLSYFQSVKTIIDEAYDTNKPSKRQEKGYIKLADIQNIKNSLPVGSIERLILSLYTDIPPVRSDYGYVAIYNTEEDRNSEENNNNYILLDEKKIVLKDFKTAKIYKQNEIDIPDVLFEEIKQSLINQPRKYLFVDASGNPYKNKVSYNGFLNRKLKIILNNQYFHAGLFRHIYITDTNINERPVNEQKQLAKAMAHSHRVQGLYRFVNT